MPFVRILNLRGSQQRPPDRVPIALGQVCLTMAQVMNQIRKRVEKLNNGRCWNYSRCERA